MKFLSALSLDNLSLNRFALPHDWIRRFSPPKSDASCKLFSSRVFPPSSRSARSAKQLDRLEGDIQLLPKHAQQFLIDPQVREYPLAGSR